MAAGYTLKELMAYMGHADLQMVNRYVKLLPQPEEHDPAERLNDYLAARRRRRHADPGGNERQIGHAVGHKCQQQRGSLGFVGVGRPLTDSARNACNRRGKRPTTAMPEEGLEPPTRGL